MVLLSLNTRWFSRDGCAVESDHGFLARSLMVVCVGAILYSCGGSGNAAAPGVEAAERAPSVRQLPCIDLIPALAPVRDELIRVHREQPSVSGTVHYLRMADALGLTPDERQAGIQLLLEPGTFEAIVRTRTGLRYQSRAPKRRAEGPFVEAHLAQAVSELLLQGVGPDTVVLLQDGQGRFEELTDDRESNYWPLRFDLEWTALSLL